MRDFVACSRAWSPNNVLLRNCGSLTYNFKPYTLSFQYLHVGNGNRILSVYSPQEVAIIQISYDGYLHWSPTNSSYAVVSPGTCRTKQPLVLGKWYTVCVQKDGTGRARLYLDNVLQDEKVFEDVDYGPGPSQYLGVSYGGSGTWGALSSSGSDNIRREMPLANIALADGLVKPNKVYASRALKNFVPLSEPADPFMDVILKQPIGTKFERWYGTCAPYGYTVYPLDKEVDTKQGITIQGNHILE